MPAGGDSGEDEAAEIWYRLDLDDRIVAVGGDNWDSVGQAVVGTRVYDHVAGHFTRKFLRDFLSRARAAEGLTRQCYRCDSPGTKRLMEMRTEMEHGRGLRVVHRTLASCVLVFPVHVRDVQRASAQYLRCSSCNRMRGKGDDVWREPDEAVTPGGTALVVHTVCPDCRHGIDLRRQSRIFRIADLADPPPPAPAGTR